MDTIDRLLEGIPIPRVVQVKQKFERPVIVDLKKEFLNQIEAKNLFSRLRKGMKVAITVGSRGISNQPFLVKLLIEELKKVGTVPFVIPAMGSHGGATAEGQRSMLEEMGFTEDYLGVPIKATMETVQIGTSSNGLPVYIDRYASEADGIILVNRIKPHVSFRGPFESGLMKMITIGLGKQKGADICHELGFGKMAENIPAIGKVVLSSGRILFGIGLIENAYHETCRIIPLFPEEIETTEPLLLEEARRLCPRLLFDSLDVLIIDEIGKDISGTGFDTNVVGRYHTPFISGGPKITRIAVLDVTDASHGNANGLGIVDFSTLRAYKKFKFDQTYPNSLTSTVPMSAKIPIILKNDRQAMQAAIKTCNILDKTAVRFVRIKNTNSLESILVSTTLLEEVRKNPSLEVVGEPFEMKFDEEGNVL